MKNRIALHTDQVKLLSVSIIFSVPLHLLIVYLQLWHSEDESLHHVALQELFPLLTCIGAAAAALGGGDDEHEVVVAIAAAKGGDFTVAVRVEHLHGRRLLQDRHALLADAQPNGTTWTGVCGYSFLR